MYINVFFLVFYFFFCLVLWLSLVHVANCLFQGVTLYLPSGSYGSEGTHL